MNLKRSISPLNRIATIAIVLCGTHSVHGQTELSLKYGVIDYDLKDVVQSYTLAPDSEVTVTRLAGSGSNSIGAEFMGFFNADSKWYGSLAVFYGSTSTLGNANFTYKYTSNTLLGDSTFEASAVDQEYYNIKIGVGFDVSGDGSTFFLRPEFGLDWESGKLVLFEEAVTYYVENGQIGTQGIVANRSLLIGAYLRLSAGAALDKAKRLRILVTPGIKWSSRLNDTGESDYFTAEPSRVAFDAVAGFSYRLNQD